MGWIRGLKSRIELAKNIPKPFGEYNPWKGGVYFPSGFDI
jgi:hypothetical protein